jgi:hypothetical protein
MFKKLIILTIIGFIMLSANIAISEVVEYTTTRTLVEIREGKTKVDDEDKIRCKPKDHGWSDCWIHCYVETKELNMSFSGGQYTGTLHIDAGDIKEEFTTVDPNGGGTYYPDVANYTMPLSMVLEITSSDDYPELVGYTIDLSGMVTDASGNLNFSFTL